MITMSTIMVGLNLNVTSACAYVDGLPSVRLVVPHPFGSGRRGVVANLVEWHNAVDNRFQELRVSFLLLDQQGNSPLHAGPVPTLAAYHGRHQNGPTKRTSELKWGEHVAKSKPHDANHKRAVHDDFGHPCHPPFTPTSASSIRRIWVRDFTPGSNKPYSSRLTCRNTGQSKYFAPKVAKQKHRIS